MQANRNIYLCQEKAPIYKRITQNHKLEVTDIRQKPLDFFTETERASTLSPAIILRALQKFLFL